MTALADGWRLEPVRGPAPVWVTRAGAYVIVADAAAVPVGEEVRSLLGTDGDDDGLGSVMALLEARPLASDLAVLHLGATIDVVLSGAAQLRGRGPTGDSIGPTRVDDLTEAEVVFDEAAGTQLSGLTAERVPATESPPDIEDRATDQETVDADVAGTGDADDGESAGQDGRRGFQLIALDQTVEPGQPLPVAASPVTALAGVVRATGKRCPVGHFNHPGARYCVQCGRGFDPGGSEIIAEAARPALGVLVTGDGRRVDVDRPVVVGRRPDQDEDVAAGRAEVLIIEGQGVSRRHARIATAGWDITITDLSTNGTYREDDDGTWVRLPAGQVTVQPGQRFRAGDQSAPQTTFRFLSHHLDNTS